MGAPKCRRESMCTSQMKPSRGPPQGVPEQCAALICSLGVKYRAWNLKAITPLCHISLAPARIAACLLTSANFPVKLLHEPIQQIRNFSTLAELLHQLLPPPQILGVLRNKW